MVLRGFCEILKNIYLYIYIYIFFFFFFYRNVRARFEIYGGSAYIKYIVYNILQTKLHWSLIM